MGMLEKCFLYIYIFVSWGGHLFCCKNGSNILKELYLAILITTLFSTLHFKICLAIWIIVLWCEMFILTLNTLHQLFKPVWYFDINSIVYYVIPN